MMDWGDAWASYSGFDIALDQIIEKSARLSKFLSDRAMAQIEYSKKLREIAQKHQLKYNCVHAKQEKINNQHTSHIAFLSMLTQTISLASKNESSGKEILSLITSKLNNCEKRSIDRRTNLNMENTKYKLKLQEQQRRVENSKTEHQKRRKEQEKATMVYQKYKEKPENQNIAEADKLRVQSMDKDALADRSKQEYNRQVKEFNDVQRQYYTKDLSDLARKQQTLFCSITECWKVTLKECVKSEVNSVQISNQANLALLREVDNVDKETDANTVFTALKRKSHFPPDIQPTNPSISESISLSMTKISIGVSKTNSSSDESSSSRNHRKQRRSSPPKEHRVDLEKLRGLGTNAERIAKTKELLNKQEELIGIENRKQDGLTRLDLSPTTNSTDIEREMRASKLAIEEYKYNIRKLKAFLDDFNKNGTSNRVPAKSTSNVSQAPVYRDRKKRRETIDIQWNVPGTKKATRLVRTAALDEFEPSNRKGDPFDKSLRQQPDGLSDGEDGYSEWDTMSVVETFGRGKMLYDFQDNSNENCLMAKVGDIIEVSLRGGSDGWTRARHVKSNQEGFIPTSYFKLSD